MKTIRFEKDDRFGWLETRRGKIMGSKLGDVVTNGGYTAEMIEAELLRLGIVYDKKQYPRKEDKERLLPLESRVALRLLAPKKLGYYDLIAERLGISADDESERDRGQRLEPEALARFEKEKGIKLDTGNVIWVREDNENIGISPDGFKGVRIAVEAKCLSSGRHIQALLTQKIPDYYHYQKLQYFIVNDKLQTLYFAFYDPRLVAKPFFTIEVKRKDVQKEVDEFLLYERMMLEDIDQVVNQLTF